MSSSLYFIIFIALRITTVLSNFTLILFLIPMISLSNSSSTVVARWFSSRQINAQTLFIFLIFILQLLPKSALSSSAFIRHLTSTIITVKYTLSIRLRSAPFAHLFKEIHVCFFRNLLLFI